MTINNKLKVYLKIIRTNNKIYKLVYLLSNKMIIKLN